MKNSELADIFDRIADLLEIKGEIIYKTLAYRRAAESLRSLAKDASAIQAENRLTDIPGVGKAIAEKITELLTTGKLDFLERLEQEVPPSLVELLQVPDIGPKKAALFWKQAGITTLAELESAVHSGQIRSLPGMGEKSEARILAGIEAVKRRTKRMLLGSARPLALRWVERLQKIAGVERIEAAGSVRRWLATIGDIDLVAASNQGELLMQAFTSQAEVQRVLGLGSNKSSIEVENGVNIQLWVQPPERFGTLLQFVTGSKDHNVRLRELAQRKGLSLSERGLARPDGTELLCATEEEVYQQLGLAWIPPELREDHGEILAAQTGHLPALIQFTDLKAELHIHTTWSDGSASIEEMALAARQRGLRVLAISDHSSGLGIVGGLSAEDLHRQRLEIQQVQAKLGDSILLLQGAEVEIHADGSLDYPDEALAELDIVVASLHSSLRQPRQAITARLVKALNNRHVDIIGHPSGRLLPNREGADLDWEAVFQAAQQNGTALEINANPYRLDLDDTHAHRAAEMGIPVCINTDAHATHQLDLAEFGIAVARRAWLEAPQVLSTWSKEKILAWLKQRDHRL